MVVAASGNDNSHELRIPYNGLKCFGEIQGMTGCTVCAKTQDVGRDARFFNQYACRATPRDRSCLCRGFP